VSVYGVLQVHSAPPALCPHIEWAVAGTVGSTVSMPWVSQPAAPGSLRAELTWKGQPGMGGAITSALAGWNRLRFEVTEESYVDTVVFDPALRDRLGDVLGHPPVLATGAGHDAGVLAAELPTAMLFVRNPTGVSHSPFETASDEDCRAGVEALTAVLRDLAR